MSGSLNDTLLFVLSNTSGDWHFLSSKGECPVWAILGFFTVFFVGTCMNLLETFALLRNKNNLGISSIILHITICDGILFATGSLELYNSYYQTWSFNNATCMIYSGIEIIANTLMFYLIICFNFHLITYWNLLHVEDNKNPLTSSSSECLVTRNEHRTIDYRKRKQDVPVTLPIFIVWILCLSLGMPKLVLSSKVAVQHGNLCLIPLTPYGNIVYYLLLIFSIAVPSILLIFCLIILICKLLKTSLQSDIDNVLVKQMKEVKKLLIFSIALTLFYMLTSFQRNYFDVIMMVREYFLYENYYFKNVSNVYRVMLHYSGTSLRGFIFYFVIPGVRKAVQCKVFCINKD